MPVQATLEVQVFRHQSVGNPVPLSVLSVADDLWDEASVTWNTAPTSGQLLSTVEVSQEVTVKLDVTSFVQAEAAGDGVVSLMLADVGLANYMLHIHSREALSSAPELILQWCMV